MATEHHMNKYDMTKDRFLQLCRLTEVISVDRNNKRHFFIREKCDFGVLFRKLDGGELRPIHEKNLEICKVFDRSVDVKIDGDFMNIEFLTAKEIV